MDSAGRQETAREVRPAPVDRGAPAPPHLEALWDALPLGAAAFDAAGRAVRTNRRFRDLVADASPCAGRTLDDLLGGVDGAAALRTAAAAALCGASQPPHRLALRASGVSSIAELTLVPLAEGGFLATVADVTQAERRRQELAEDLEEQFRVGNALYEYMLGERDRLEQIADARAHELLRLQEKHARDRRLAAVGQLAAGVMHDVNNCLNPIVAAAHLLQLRADDPAAVCDYARRIAKAAESGAATAARVGRFIRQDPLPGGIEKMVDLSVLADEVVAITRPVWSMRTGAARVQLVFDCAPGAVIHGVEGELRAALVNLVYNAVDAMPDGGTLSLGTASCAAGVTLEVRDTGVGMSAEVRERAFEPFFSTKGVAGSGLGLSEVYGIVKRHLGRVEIDSAPGRGTAVRLVFPSAAPVASASGAGTAAAASAPASPRRVPRRVLIVEDHVDGREFMRALLASDGHAVDAVGSVRDALRCLETRVDVVVTDIGLPDGSGWDVIAAARERWPGVRAGVVTGWEPHAVDTGQAHFTLRKPVRVQDLLAIVDGDG